MRRKGRRGKGGVSVGGWRRRLGKGTQVVKVHNTIGSVCAVDN